MSPDGFDKEEEKNLLKSRDAVTLKCTQLFFYVCVLWYRENENIKHNNLASVLPIFPKRILFLENCFET